MQVKGGAKNLMSEENEDYHEREDIVGTSYDEYLRKSKDEKRRIRELFEVCDICFQTDGLVIDHDHSTGLIRGALCPSCNHVLGRVRDNENTLLNAVAYLRRAKSREKELNAGKRRILYRDYIGEDDEIDDWMPV